VEADRVARGRVIEEQGRKSVALESAVYLTEQNRDWHRAEAARLSAELEELDRALRQEIAGLRRDLVDRDQAIAKTQANWWVRAGRRLKLL
jgi:hypothetical protein